KAIAHQGKFLLQSQHDDTEVNAAKNVRLTATDGKLIGLAPEIVLIANDGSFIKIGNGITLGTQGTIEQKAVSFPHSGPATMAAELPTFDKGQTDQKFILQYQAFSEAAEAAANTAYRIQLSDGSVVEGKSDEQGHTELLQRDVMRIAKIELFRDKE
ncbi:DUF2345 domain-containing protein, partial [Chitinivorax sp. B]|uniref:DUF2345 domain-containing protein n=1 Tax=Chitinivorax sp. B TaxID=2502235 RepID=UPI0010F43CD0